MKEYVLGFMFDGPNVVLIRKNRPEWQAGKLNGVGGKVEPGETPEQAMSREFGEEAGIPFTRWARRVVMRGKDWAVHVFTSTLAGASGVVFSATDEPVEVHPHAALPDDVIPNLPWLIPMCREAYHQDRQLIVLYDAID